MVMSGSTTLDLSAAGLGLAALGSLSDGAGSPTGQQVLLGGNTLDVGLDNTSTTFSGAISGSGGSLIKQGTGTFDARRDEHLLRHNDRQRRHPHGHDDGVAAGLQHVRQS